jgi:hypothetical protein
MELAHNICLPHLERFRNIKDKIKDLELSDQAWDKDNFKLRKYYLIGPE